MEVISCETVQGVFHDTLWHLYHRAMHSLEASTPFKQGMDEAGFRQAMTDPDFIKYILIQDGEPSGILLIATTISKVEWLAEHYFNTNFAGHVIHYMVGVAVREVIQKPSSLGATRLIKAAISGCPADGIFCFDFSTGLHGSLFAYTKHMAIKTGCALLGPKNDAVVDHMAFLAVQRQAA